MKSFTALRAAAVIGAVLMLWIAPPPATADGVEVLQPSNTVKFYGDNRGALVKVGLRVHEFESISLYYPPSSTWPHKLIGHLVLHDTAPGAGAKTLIVYPISSAKWLPSETFARRLYLKIHDVTEHPHAEDSEGILDCTGPFYDQTISCKGELRGVKLGLVMFQFGSSDSGKNGVSIRRVCPFRHTT